MSLDEEILYGILGLLCLSSITIIFYILRNYRLIEEHKDSTDEFQRQLDYIIKKMKEEEKIKKENSKRG